MTSALALYEDDLAGNAPVELVRPGGIRHPLPVAAWAGQVTDADELLLDGCTGPTLDVGCGAGRLTAALTGRGVPALGVDLSAVAVDMTRRRGAMAVRGDVFGDVRGSGRWSHVLLADGNIGIGGDPVRLLRRCHQLIKPTGSILLDVEPPGAGLLIERIRLRTADRLSEPFRWCWLGIDALPRIADAAGLVVQDTWRHGDRWQAQLGEPA